MDLTRFPRVRLGHLPTPLELLPRLSEHLGYEIWIKRDDCTGVAFGGNKTRKLEFLLGEAQAQGADVVLTQGAVQSNHARQTAAFATRLGLACHLLLENRVAREDQDYTENGNVLLNRLLGAEIERFAAGTDMNGLLQSRAEELRGQGRKPYVIVGGGSQPTGALGYVNGIMELMAQVNAQGLRVGHVVHATGSAGTQAGVVCAMSAMQTYIPVLGIGVRVPQKAQEENVHKLCCATAEKLKIAEIPRAAVVANCDYVGEGYGIPHASTLEALTLLAKLEGILLDPVYSAKGMAGLIDLCRKGYFPRDEAIVFIHTGGAPALFGYGSSVV